MPVETATMDTIRRGVARVVEKREPVTVDELRANLRELLRDPSACFTARTLMNWLALRGLKFDEPGSQPILVPDLTAVLRELGLEIGVINPNTNPEFMIFGSKPTQPQA